MSNLPFIAPRHERIDKLQRRIKLARHSHGRVRQLEARLVAMKALYAALGGRI